MPPSPLAATLAGCRGIFPHPVHPGFPLLRVHNAGGEAVIALQGAQVLRFRSSRSPHPVLYRHPDATPRSGSEVMGGAPVCWPWFGRHPDDPRQPSHGFAQTRRWELVEVNEEPPDETRLVFRLPPEDLPPTRWPGQAELTLTVLVGAALELRLATRNAGAEPIRFGNAFHTYFAVSDRAEVSVEGFEDRGFFDFMDGGKEKTAGGPITFPDAVSRFYPDASGVCRLHDPRWNRRVTIGMQGHRGFAVWSPDLLQTRNFADLPGESFRSFVCLEPVNTGAAEPNLAPGATHELRQRIEID